MNAAPSEFLFSPSMLLWLAASATAIAILIGTVNRRKSRLTDTLRQFVDRSQAESPVSPPKSSSAGTRAAGTRAAGTRAAGTRAAGTRATGAKPPGNDKSARS